MGKMKMQMPPTSSISNASTVAKIGRPMKKLTMAVLSAVPGRSSLLWDAGRGSGLVVRPAGRGVLVGFGFPAWFLVSVGPGLPGGCLRSGRTQRFGRGRRGLDRQTGPDELHPLHDDLLTGLETRLKDAEALVGNRRPDRDH